MPESDGKTKARVTLSLVRAKCLDCCGDQANEVRLCTATQCTLWPYRFGSQTTYYRNHHPELLKAAERRSKGLVLQTAHRTCSAA